MNRFYIGVTDNYWFDYLSRINPEDVNFWQPGGNKAFRAIERWAPFLFKLRKPENAIAGVGFFSSHTFLPISVAWEMFAEGNGCATYAEFQRLIIQRRADKIDVNPRIGCIVLTDPVFFSREDWVEVPDNWSKSVQQGKLYYMQDPNDAALWAKVQVVLEKYQKARPEAKQSQLTLEEPSARYGSSYLSKVRLGQGAFRVLVTDSYSRRCAITGEKTLPVLEAAHIKPYALSGPHAISNGLLLRSDMHKLFDTGYITITNDLKVEVSNRIREEFQNGKEYYKYHGENLLYLPNKDLDKPSHQFIDWHNTTVFKS